MAKITDIKRDTQMEIVDRFNTKNGQDNSSCPLLNQIE